LQESHENFPHCFHVSPAHVLFEHSSVHAALHWPFEHVWPEGQSAGGPQLKQPFGSKWPHVTVPVPEHCTSPSLHSSVHAPGRHAPFEHVVASGHASSGSQRRHELDPARPHRSTKPDPAQRDEPSEHSSTHVAAHRPSEQYGAFDGHALGADHDAHASPASFTHVFTPSPLHARSPGVHQAPHGRCAKSTRTSVD
jgi:hypothetical protein